MLYLKKFIQQTVHAETPEEFDSKLNAAYTRMLNLHGRDMDIHYFDNLGLCATIRYWIEQQTPETAEEAYRMEGISVKCEECGHFKKSADKRLKWGRCEYKDCRMRMDCPACSDFYEEMERRGGYAPQPKSRDAKTGHHECAAR